ANAERFRGRAGWSPNSGGYPPDTLAEFQQHLTDLHQGLDIVSVHFYNRNSENERFGLFTGRTNVDFLNVIKQTADAAGKQLFLGAFADANPYLNQDPNGLFTQNVLNQIVQLRIPYSAVWPWEYYQSNPYTTYNNQDTFSNLEPGYTDLLIARLKQ